MKKALIIIFVALLAVSAAIGIYFVNYALKRQILNYEIPPTNNSKVDSNTSEIKQHEKAWLKNNRAETWSQTSFDGLNLVANFYPNNNSHKYVIVVHGYTSKKEDMLSYAAYFHDWGFNVLAPDNRAHGQSEGKWIGMGWFDSQDHLQWINKIINYDPQAQITMLGVSMGGATVMMTSGLDLPDNVKCLIEDCGYSSVWDEFVFQLKAKFNLPAFPVMHISDLMSKIICKYGLKEASSLTRLGSAKVPILFIHGTADTFVPYEMLDKNTAAYNGPYKEVLRVQHATHATAINYARDEYLNTVHNFVDKFIK